MADLANYLDDESLRATAELFAGAGADDELDAVGRFVRRGVGLIRKRRTRSESASDGEGIALFVLARSTDVPGGLRLEREWMLDQAKVEISGRLWLTNESVNSAHHATHEYERNDLFEWVISELDLGEFPAILYDPATDGGEIRVYREGLSSPDEVEIYALASTDAPDFDAVRRVIDVVHHETLISPQHQIDHVSTWKSPPQYRASSHAEAIVQSHVRIALKLAFIFFEIEKEGPVDSGRFDLTISQVDFTSKTRKYHGVLELKVLRTFGANGSSYSDAQNSRALDDGLTQAISYRQDLPSDWAALCCFDMRRTEQDDRMCFAGIADRAVSEGISLARWRLFNSSKAYREARRASREPVASQPTGAARPVAETPASTGMADSR